jgi:uncharacterized membrane protein HdeD (DUF308 family)
VSGVTTLVPGPWPLSGLWVIGLFVGIDMFFYGWWLASLALSARRLAAA